jgi:hypothetical protein
VSSKFGVQLLPVVISAVVSASVAVVVVETVTPQSTGAAQSAIASARHAKPISLSAVNKSLGSGFRSTDKQITSLQTLLETDTTRLQGEIGTLQTNLNNVASNTSQAEAFSSQNNSALNTLTPIVRSSAERLYDTCALVAGMWSDSVANTPWSLSRADAQNIGNETSAVDTCYLEFSSQGELRSSLQTHIDDPFTAPGP